MASTNCGDDSLQTRFAATRAAYGRTAQRYKFWYSALWWPGFLLTWVMLLARIVWSSWQPEHATVLRAFEYGIAGSGVLVVFLTLGQLLLGFRESWIDNRVAAETLRIAGLKHQYGIGRYAGDNADEKLEQLLARVGNHVDKSWRRMFRHRVLPYLSMLWRQKAIAAGEPVPLGQQIGPSFARELLDTPEARDRLLGYIEHQRAIHYNRARSYVWRYVGLQFLVIVFSGTVAAMNFFGWPEERVLYSAVLFVLGLMAVSIREFSDLPPLFQRYYHVAEGLADAVDQYREGRGPFSNLTEPQRRQQLAAETARILRDELLYWHAQAGRTPRDLPDEEE